MTKKILTVLMDMGPEAWLFIECTFRRPRTRALLFQGICRYVLAATAEQRRIRERSVLAAVDELRAGGAKEAHYRRRVSFVDHIHEALWLRRSHP